MSEPGKSLEFYFSRLVRLGEDFSEGKFALEFIKHRGVIVDIKLFESHIHLVEEKIEPVRKTAVIRRGKSHG